MINISNSSIKKQIFDEAILLICFGYNLDYLQSCLIKVKEANIIKSDLAISFIGIISAKNVFVWVISKRFIFVGNTSAKDTYIDIGLSDIGSWLSIK